MPTQERLLLAGSLTGDDAARLRAAVARGLDAAKERRVPLVIDFSATSFIDDIGALMVAGIGRAARMIDVRVRLTNLPVQVRGVLEHVDALELFDWPATTKTA